jgi:RNA polymerase sigma-70 factor, ECF subfamily
MPALVRETVARFLNERCGTATSRVVFVHATVMTAHREVAAPLTFDALYEENVRFLWSMARAMGVPPNAVDDVLQDLFVIAHAKLGEFEARGSVRAWLVAILVRVEANHRRHRSRRQHDELDDGLAAPKSDDPVAVIEREESARILDELLATLDDEKRIVFVMSELHEMTAKEIGDALGLSSNTVSTRLRRGRMQFEQAVARRRAREKGGA